MNQTKETLSPAEIRKRRGIDMRAGDTVRVSVKIEEKGKTRTQEFEGIVLARKHGNEPGATFTVRRTSGGIGVEKIFPLFSPLIDKIEVVKRSKVRQSNLYHIRRKAAKEVKKYVRNVRTATYNETEEEEEFVEEAKEEEPKDENQAKQGSSEEEAGSAVEKEETDEVDEESVKEDKK